MIARLVVAASVVVSLVAVVVASWPPWMIVL